MKPLVFVRIPRTASTSLFRAIERTASSVLSTADVAEAAAGLDVHDFIHGHIVLDQALWPEIARRARTLTVLREPIDRLVSLYYRFRLDPGYPYRIDLQTMSLADFVASGQKVQTYQANDDMVRRLSGVDFPFGENCWHVLDKALRNLEAFDVVGVYGWFVSLRKALGLSSLEQISVSELRPTVGALDPVDLEAIQEYNQMDFALYAAATERVAGEMRVGAQHS